MEALTIQAEEAERVIGQGAIMRLAYDLASDGNLTRETLREKIDERECEDWAIGGLYHAAGRRVDPMIDALIVEGYLTLAIGKAEAA